MEPLNPVCRAACMSTCALDCYHLAGHFCCSSGVWVGPCMFLVQATSHESSWLWLVIYSLCRRLPSV